MKAEVDAPMMRHITRWGYVDKEGYPYTYGSWLFYIDRTYRVLKARNYLFYNPEGFDELPNYAFPNGDFFLRQVESTITRYENRFY